MEFHFSPEDEKFREQARSWLEENRPRDERPEDFSGQKAYDLGWQKKQYEGGWAGPAWPKAYGGQEMSLTRQLIWSEEYARAGCPFVLDAAWLGINHAGPTLIVKGSEEQKAFHLPKILNGDVGWCQGFSEPNAGSDLASLRTRGVIDGDHLVVSGQKTWTSFAPLADYMELLVRTDADSSKRHRGISWVIADMHAPGVEIRPIKGMTGDYHNSEVFFDEVRIPLSNVVGEINGGWSVTMATLSFERGTAGFGEICQLRALVEELIDYAKTHTGPDGRRPAIADDNLGPRLAQARAEVQALHSLLHLTISRLQDGTPGAESSIVRLAQSEIDKRVSRLAIDLLGARGLDRSSHPKLTHQYLFSYCQTIAGGTAEIQRNTIGERVLGLPR